MNNILDTANLIVHGERRHDYGHPFDDFNRTALMWSAITGTNITAEMVGLMMCCMKISRQIHFAKDDNLVDLAGYAETVNMVIQERARRANERSR